MAHKINGFTLKYTHRGSWKASISKGKELLGEIPITWTKDYRKSTEGRHFVLTVWFQDQADLDAALNSKKPFLVAVAKAVDDNAHPKQFQNFTSVVEVTPIGPGNTENCIETKVERRFTANDLSADYNVAPA